MDRPDGPRRRSNTSDPDEHKKPQQRKTFVVGAKNRVPSYGKKLNQLGKLTTLTTNDHDDEEKRILPRSNSQRSLNGTRRVTSSQDVRKLRRASNNHGSSTALKPLSQAVKTKPAKRPTFVIDDDEEDVEGEEHVDVASSFAETAVLTEPTKKENVDLGELKYSVKPQSNDKVVRTKTSSGLLYQPVASPAVPRVSTEHAVAKDIQSNDKKSTDTPAQSQPMTSMFLESPRREPVISTTKEEIVAPIRTHSPHGSTANLGGGSSRTQQKLLLQRASSIFNLDGSSNETVPAIKTRDFDRIAKEYQNVKRYRDPQKELAYRLFALGIALPSRPAIRRTMTQQGSLSKAAAPARPATSAVNLQTETPVNTVQLEAMLSKMWSDGS